MEGGEEEIFLGKVGVKPLEGEISHKRILFKIKFV